MKSKPKILIIEDEKVLSEMYKTKFLKEGFEVSQAFDGATGLNKALSEKPDLILLDIIMPKKHGLEVLAALQKDEWGKSAKVIVLTNAPDYAGFGNISQGWHYEVMVKSDSTPEQVVKKVKEKLNN
jgi:CheY-like chemotaxis protein